ncbi:MAG: glycosyltransferase family 39 protein [Anaerolineae bacterium]
MPARRSAAPGLARALRIAYVVLCLSVLVDLAVYLVDHRSTSLLALAALAAAFALVGIGMTVVTARLLPERVVRLRARAARWRDLYLVGALLILGGFGLGMRPEWTYVHIAVMLCGGFCLAYLYLYADSPPLSRRWLVVLGVAFVVVTLARVNALSDYPSHYVDDEPWDLGWAMSYLQRGYFTDPIMYYGGFDIQRFMLLPAWWIGIFGPGFWQTRLFFFLMIFPMTALTGLAARNFFGSGWITVLVMLCSAVVMGAARIRHDVGLALALAAALWLYSAALKRGRLRDHFRAGLAIGLGWFAHYHAIGFGMALTIAFYLPGYVERWRQHRRAPEPGMALFIVGGLVGAGLVFLLQIIPDWAGFTAIREPRTPRDLGEFITTFAGHWGTLFAQSPFEFALVLAAIAAALWRRTRTDIMLVILVVLLHIALAVQANLTLAYYLVPLSPVYALLVAAPFEESVTHSLNRSLAWVMAALILIVNLGVTLQSPLEHLRSGAPLQLPAPTAIAWIKQHVAPTQTIVAEHWYYLFLTDYRFISTASQRYAPVSIQTEPSEAVWDQIAPDFVVIDPNISTCCVPPIMTTDYLDSRGYQQVAEFEGERYPVLVYEKGGGS